MPQQRRHHLGLIDIPPDVAAKIQEKHNLSPGDVRSALQAPSRYRTARWVNDPLRGRRLMVISYPRLGGRAIKAYLKPVDPRDGRWKLGTAFTIKQ